MFKFALSILLTVVSTALPALAQSTSPQPTKIFVSSYGKDTNDGSRATPKRSFQAAHDSVAPKGSIVVLDTAGYGKVTITKSVAIVVPTGVSGFITSSGDDDAVIVRAGSNDMILLQGLIIEGAGILNGIKVYTANTLIIEDSQIRNFYNGMSVDTTALLKLEVYRSTIQNVSNGANLGGYLDAKFVNVSVSKAGGTAFSVTKGGSGDALLLLSKSEASTSGTGVATNNGAQVFLDGCTISHNGTAVAVSGGIAFTLNNNTIAFNTTFLTGASQLTSTVPR